jgi:hypothetical protein
MFSPECGQLRSATQVVFSCVLQYGSSFGASVAIPMSTTVAGIAI